MFSSSSTDPSKSLKFDAVPKLAWKAELQIKLSRLRVPLFVGIGIQVAFMIFYAIFFPKSYCSINVYGINYLCDVFYTVELSVFSFGNLFMMTPICLIVLALSILISGPTYNKETMGNDTLWKTSLWKPIGLGLLTAFYVYWFIMRQDDKYSTYWTTTQDDESIKYNVCYLGEKILIILMTAFMVAVEFYRETIEKDGFFMADPLLAKRWDIIEVVKEIKDKRNWSKGIYFAFQSFFWYIVIMRLGFLLTIGIEGSGNDSIINFIWNFIFDTRFLIRLSLIAISVKISLNAVLNVVNTYMSKELILPLEDMTRSAEHMLLHEAMASENRYIKHLAYSQFFMMGVRINKDTSLHGLSLSGNLKRTWNEVFKTCTEFLKSRNKFVKEFTQTGKISSKEDIKTAPSPSNLQRTEIGRLKPVTFASSLVNPNNPIDNRNQASFRNFINMIDEDLQQMFSTLTNTFRIICSPLRVLMVYLISFTPLKMSNSKEKCSDLEINTLFLENHWNIYFTICGMEKLLLGYCNGFDITVVWGYEEYMAFILEAEETIKNLLAVDNYIRIALSQHPNRNKKMLTKLKRSCSHTYGTTSVAVVNLGIAFRNIIPSS